jgi:tetratricopeptide (TPR) repeat protein
MIVSRIDPEARSTSAAAEGFRALAAGDTVLAKQKYTEAGAILKRGASGTAAPPEKNLLRFLAATQYYHAGAYRQALHLCERIRVRHLSAPDRERFESFRKSVEARSSTEYPVRIRLAVVNCWAQGQTQEALKLLQDHPYVMERSALAWIRADLCYKARQWRLAALFYADAIRFADAHPTPLFLCATGALSLHTAGRRDDAWEYTQQLLEIAPTALNLVTASTLRYHRLIEGNLEVGRELLELFERAKQQWQQLPDRTKADRDAHAFMAFGYLVAATAADRMGDRTRAVQLCQEAIAFDPTGESTPAFKGILTASETGDDAIRLRMTHVDQMRQERTKRQMESRLPSTAA